MQRLAGRGRAPREVMTPPPPPVPAFRNACSMPDTAAIARLGTDDADGVLTPRGLFPDLRANMPAFVGTLRESFLAGLPEAVRASAAAVTDLPLRLEALAEVAERYPELSRHDFVRYAARHVGESEDVAGSLSSLHAEDLALACACSHGDEAALTDATERLAPAIRAAAARVLPEDAVEDHLADVLQRLLVAVPPAPPDIAKYSGRGRLVKWVQTVAVRAAHSRTRKRTEDPSDDVESLAARLVESSDPELAALKATYRAQFKAAFRRALAELTPQRRNVLRLELLDRLTIDAIARLYNVHPATISRWRADTRGKLLRSTRRVFQREHAVARDEFESIMRLIGSQLEVSLPRLLDEDEDEDEHDQR